jgi:hypothetical protein
LGNTDGIGDAEKRQAFILNLAVELGMTEDLLLCGGFVVEVDTAPEALL